MKLLLLLAISRSCVVLGSGLFVAASLPAFPQEHGTTFEQDRPRIEHPKLLRVVRWTAVVAAGLDDGYSVYHKYQNNFSEVDPVAKPITNLPTPAYASCAVALIALGYFASVKMEHNRHLAVRRAAWILPIASGLANGIAFGQSLKRYN